MFTSEGSAKPYAAGVICIITILTVAFIVLDSNSPREVPVIARECAIPPDAVKMTINEDLYPPVLHSENWSQRARLR